MGDGLDGLEEIPNLAAVRSPRLDLVASQVDRALGEAVCLLANVPTFGLEPLTRCPLPPSSPPMAEEECAVVLVPRRDQLYSHRHGLRGRWKRLIMMFINDLFSRLLTPA